MRTAYTLFTGGGGADIGLCAAGYTLTGGIEYDARIAEVYARNMGHALTVADIRSVDPALLPVAAPAWLHASPVCKNFSAAKTDGVEDEGDIAMADAVVRFLDAWEPPTFSLEQVWAYRESVSFGRITSALRRLGYSFDFWHLNAADYGVPQTRRRLILVAKCGAWYIQRPEPTHREGGDMFAPPWVGWYEAIEDLIPTLPPSQFAQWQLDRLGGVPSSTFVLEGTSSGEDFGIPLRVADEPMFTIKAAIYKSVTRAFIAPISTESEVRYDNEPSHTVTAQDFKNMRRAFLADLGNTSRPPTILEAEQPAMTVQVWHGRRPSHMPVSWLERGRVVKMTLRALARFQSFPDWYEPQSTVEIGNAVPPLLMQRIAENFNA